MSDLKPTLLGGGGDDDTLDGGSPPPAYTPVKTYTILYVPQGANKAPEYLKVTLDDQVVFCSDVKSTSLIGSGANVRVREPKSQIQSSIDIDSQTFDAAFDVVAECKVPSKKKELEFTIFSPRGPTMSVEQEAVSRHKMHVRHVSARVQYTFQASGKTWVWKPKERDWAGWNTPQAYRIMGGKDQWAYELFEAQAAQTAGANGAALPASTALNTASPEATMALIHYSPFEDIPPYPQPQKWRVGMPALKLMVLKPVDDVVLKSALVVALGVEEREKKAHGKEGW